jgi:hypothetical protein
VGEVSEPTDQEVDLYALSAARLRATEWVVIGIYCDGSGDDGSASRHAPEPVANYRRIADPEVGHLWVPLHSSNDRNAPLVSGREWLNDADEVVQERPGMMAGHRAHETFTCSVCPFNWPRRWEDVERVLDAAYELPRPRILLREWARWTR